VIVTIERILPGGLGLAHADGKTLLVSLAAPGDLVQVKIDRKQGKVAFASIVEIVQPSPVRVAPPCRYFGECGGCDFQQLDYAAQLEAKAGIIRATAHAPNGNVTGANWVIFRAAHIASAM
jgi:23S rRNA (uracil1939-C5)-methyltransferase